MNYETWIVVGQFLSLSFIRHEAVFDGTRFQLSVGKNPNQDTSLLRLLFIPVKSIPVIQFHVSLITSHKIQNGIYL